MKACSCRLIPAVLLLIVLTGCRDQILHNLAEDEANHLLTRLHEGAIEGEKVRQPDGKWAIAVARGDSIIALKYLSDSRLLRSVSRPSNDRSSVVSSREDQRFRYERALSWEIEQTLSSIAGVLESRVHLNLPQLDPLFGQSFGGGATGSASVLLVTTGTGRFDEPRLKALVSGASGIPIQQIALVVSTVNSQEPIAQDSKPSKESYKVAALASVVSGPDEVQSTEVNPSSPPESQRSPSKEATETHGSDPEPIDPLLVSSAPLMNRVEAKGISHPAAELLNEDVLEASGTSYTGKLVFSPVSPRQLEQLGSFLYHYKNLILGCLATLLIVGGSVGLVRTKRGRAQALL